MIEVKHDPKIEFPTIEIPMLHEDEENPYSPIKQTNVEGVLVPLFRYNNYTITFDNVVRMKLTCDNVPRITVVFLDSYGIIKPLDTPGVDSVLYLQILPPFDDAYKKIQLGFRITNVKIKGSLVSLSGSYYVPKIEQNVMKPYGFLSTYDLFEKVSNEYGLGFCSNVSGTQDERYIYNANKKPLSFLNDEIVYAGEKEHVFEWWVDFWNNINLVDIYKEYTKPVPDDELLIWITDNLSQSANPDSSNPEPYQQSAVLCNIPAMAPTDLFIRDYTPKVSAGGTTDMNFEVYMLDKQDRYSTLIQDGDVKKNIVENYEYGGEIFGDFDYLTRRATRNMFIRKINSQVIEVKTKNPLLGLMKGGHINMLWYDTNNIIIDKYITDEVESNIPVGDDFVIGDDKYKINKTISGQYYISNITYEYDGEQGWVTTYILSRSADMINRVNEPAKETFMS